MRSFTDWVEQRIAEGDFGDPSKAVAMEPSNDDIDGSQSMWQSAVDILPYYNNDMNKALAAYVAHMIEGHDNPKILGTIQPQEAGKQLGMALINAQHIKTKMAKPVDRNLIFQYIQKSCPKVADVIINAANQTYALYEPRPFTKGTMNDFKSWWDR